MHLCKTQHSAAHWYDQGFMSSYRTKIPSAKDCVSGVNIITGTFKARISHKEKLKFCNYTIIKALLTSHVSYNPTVFNCTTVIIDMGKRKDLGFPLVRSSSLIAKICMSRSSACTGWSHAVSPLNVRLVLQRNSHLYLLIKAGGKNMDLQSFIQSETGLG